MCAAISAAQNGAKVILFEKQAQLGGNGMMPEGLFAVNSPKQAELGIESPRKIDIIANEFQFNNFRITYDYWSNYIDGSGESVAWLLDLGVVIERVESMFGSPEVFHYGEGGHCEQMIETLIAATDTLGIDVHLNTPAIRLKQEDGAVVGAYAESRRHHLGQCQGGHSDLGRFLGRYGEGARVGGLRHHLHADAPEPRQRWRRHAHGL